MIDYVITNYSGWNKIRQMKIGERVESDHQPLEVEIETKSEVIRKEENRVKFEERIK